MDFGDFSDGFDAGYVSFRVIVIVNDMSNLLCVFLQLFWITLGTCKYRSFKDRSVMGFRAGRL